MGLCHMDLTSQEGMGFVGGHSRLTACDMAGTHRYPGSVWGSASHYWVRPWPVAGTVHVTLWTKLGSCNKSQGLLCPVCLG